MSLTIHYSHCPVCHSSNIAYALDAKDYTVSKQVFPIWHCSDCTARFTQDVPDLAGVGAFYQSDDYVSHSDTKEGLINQLYHRVRNITLLSKRKLIQTASGFSLGKLLDVGCGTGAFLGVMAKAGWDVLGLEPDPGAREKGKQLHGVPVEAVEQLFSLPKGGYDVITMWHVLEHVHALQDYVKQLKTLLAPGGTLVIAVPNYTSKDAQYYGPYWAAYDVPRHLYHFSPASMRQLMQQHGLKVVGVKPMWFDSFYVSMLSEQYKTGQQRLVSAVLSGLGSNVQTLWDTERCSSVIYIIKQ